MSNYNAESNQKRTQQDEDGLYNSNLFNKGADWRNRQKKNLDMFGGDNEEDFRETFNKPTNQVTSH